MSLVSLCGFACGATPPPAAPGADERSTPLHEGPLTDYVPAAGLRWMVVARPEELAEDARLAKTLERLLPPHRLDAFAASAGLDLRTMPEALVAGFSFGTLYLAELQDSGEAVEQRFSDRLLDGPRRHRPHPRVTRLTGVAGGSPRTLVRIEGTLVAVAVGDPSLARAVVGFATRRLRRAAPALQGAALSTLPSDLERAPLRFYAPGPFQGEWTRGARGLLAGALAVGVAVRPEPPDLDATVVISGTWTRPSDADWLERGWKDVAASSFGRLLGFHRPAREPEVLHEPSHLRLLVRVELEPIVHGLHSAVAANIWEMMELEGPEAPNGSP